jgi:hypothetical protein
MFSLGVVLGLNLPGYANLLLENVNGLPRGVQHSYHFYFSPAERLGLFLIVEQIGVLACVVL